MLLWITFAALTAFAAIAIASPFWRTVQSAEGDGQDLAVYKQQLTEVEEEHARGLLGDAEAAAARVEISRRILTAAEDKDRGTSSAQPFAPYLVIALIAVSSMGTYLYFGSPNVPDQPLSARVAPEQQQLLQQPIDNLIAQVEERLKKTPDDGAGWNVVGPVYMRLGRYQDAVHAFRRALDLLGESPDRWIGLGEALTFSNGGVVTPEAADAFQKVLKDRPDDFSASFWLAAHQEQTNKLAEAAKSYQALLTRTLPDDVKAMVGEKLAGVQARISGVQPPAVAAKPAFDDSQMAMINQMVSGLAARLKADGSDLDGWLKLMRAYTVLGRRDDALSALKQAESQFAENKEALAQIDEFAKSLGLKS